MNSDTQGLLAGANPTGQQILKLRRRLKNLNSLISGLREKACQSKDATVLSLLEHACANALSATTQQLAAALGVAVGTVALRLGGPIGHLFYRHPSPTTSYTVAFVVLALFALAAMAGATRLTPEAGGAVRQARGRSAAGPPPRAP